MPAQQQNDLKSILKEISNQSVFLGHLKTDLIKMYNKSKSKTLLYGSNHKQRKKLREEFLEKAKEGSKGIRDKLKELKKEHLDIETQKIPVFDYLDECIDNFDGKLEEFKKFFHWIISKQKIFDPIFNELIDINKSMFSSFSRIKNSPYLKDNVYRLEKEPYIKEYEEKIDKVKKELEKIKKENQGIEELPDFIYLVQLYEKLKKKCEDTRVFLGLSKTNPLLSINSQPLFSSLNPSYSNETMQTASIENSISTFSYKTLPDNILNTIFSLDDALNDQKKPSPSVNSQQGLANGSNEMMQTVSIENSIPVCSHKTLPDDILNIIFSLDDALNDQKKPSVSVNSQQGLSNRSNEMAQSDKTTSQFVLPIKSLKRKATEKTESIKRIRR